MAVSFGSVAVAALAALFFTFLFRFAALHHPGHAHFEVAIIILAQYSIFGLAEAMHLSGIVASLTSAFIMSYYTAMNLSEEGRLLTVKVLKIVAGMSFDSLSSLSPPLPLSPSVSLSLSLSHTLSVCVCLQLN